MRSSTPSVEYSTQLLPETTHFLGEDHGHFINGRYHKDGDEFIDVVDPGNGHKLTRVPRGSVTTVNTAVDAALNALSDKSWGGLTGHERTKLIWRLSERMEEQLEVFAQLETLDVGKPIAASRGDVAAAIDTFRYMAGWATKLTGETYPVGSPGSMHAYTKHHPIGVVGLIVPWNFPLVMAAWKVAPALAAGCTCVLKPAEQTPLTALYLARLAAEVGIPAGVLNVVVGEGKDVGDAIVRHSLVKKIAFTGSTRVGKSIARIAAEDLKAVTLELGGKNSTIVMDDADLDKAIPGVMQAAFGNSGQICTAPSRILVHQTIISEFSQQLATATENLAMGHGLNTDVTLGPVVSEHQRSSITKILQAGLNDGGELVTGGHVPDSPGYYLEPTIVSGLGVDSAMVQTEIFGPVVNLIPFTSEKEAVQIANNTTYGLTAQIWSQNVSSIHRMADALDTGTVWVNGKSQDISLPFGGYKDSGTGLEKGHDGVLAYTRLKTVAITL